MGKKNGQRKAHKAKPVPTPAPRQEPVTPLNSYIEPEKPPSQQTATAPPSPPLTPPPTADSDSRPSTDSLGAARFSDKLITDALELLDRGLVANAYSLLSSASSAGTSASAPSPSRLTSLARLAAHVHNIQHALVNEQWALALKEWNDARDLWMQPREGGSGAAGVPWVAKVWRFEALEGARKWSELDSNASQILREKPGDCARAALAKATALYQLNKISEASAVLSNVKSGTASALEKVKILSNRLLRLSTLKAKGAAAFKAQQWGEAIKWYSQAIEVDTECRAVRAVLLGNRGLAKLKDSSALAAVADFSAAISLNPRYVKALHHRAQAYLQLDDLSNAYEDLVVAASIAPEGSEERRSLERERDEVRARKLKQDAEKRKAEEDRKWAERQAKRKDHYKILGVERDATIVEIKAAFKKLAMSHHPDKGGDEEKFKELRASYEILSDERRRQRYDEDSDDDDGCPCPFHSGMADDDDDMFGGGAFPFFFYDFLFSAARERRAGSAGSAGPRGGRGGARGGTARGRGRGRAAPAPTPNEEEILALLDCCRYGDVDEGDFDDIKRFAKHYGDRWLAEAKDDRGNTPLHMAAGNGHVDIVKYLVDRLPVAALSAQNTALSTPLHWAALNYHLAVLELICPLLPLDAFSLQNTHGKTAVQEAEEACEALVVSEADQDTPRGQERVRREKCVGYLLGCMGLGVKKPTGGDESKAEEAEGELKAGPETAGGEAKKDDETVRRLTEQAEKIKLEQEEKAKSAAQ